MINKFAVLKAFLVMPILLLFAPSASSMEKWTQYFWEYAACPNEVVYMEGSVRFQYHETRMGWVFQAFWTGDGWGEDSDNEYLINGKWQEVVQGHRPFIFYWNDHFQLVGKDGAPTYRLYSKIRFNEFGSEGPDSIIFEDGDWPCPTIGFGTCDTEPCSAP
jgi:hypothetical protein